MSAVEQLHWITYVVALVALLGGVVGAWSPRFAPYARRLTQAGLAVLTVSIALRWVITGHPPIFGTFENSIASAWFVAAFVVLADLPRFRDALPRRLGRALGLWVLPLLAVGLFFERSPYPLTISERSLLVDVHVLFAWGAHTVLLAAGTAAIVVMAGREDGEGPLWEQVLFRGAGVGFALFSVMMVLGSAYSFLLFSDWFRWEIVEAFAAATWLAYGLALHAAMMFGWRGRRLASALLVASVLMLCTFWVWSFWSGTYHHFEIPAIRAE